MSAALLQAKNLTLALGGRTLCRELTITLRPGERWGLLGRNGSGKTTLLHTLAGLHVPQFGAVALHERELTDWPRRALARELGVLLQDDADDFPSTVLDAVLVGRHPHLSRFALEGEAEHAAALAALEKVGLATLAQRSLATLSGGERRRVALARLFTQDPCAYLLDEPTNHLDLHHQVQLLDLVSTRVHARQGTALMSLHDINLALRYCDRLLLLFDGGEWLAGRAEVIVDAEVLGRLYGHPITALQGPTGLPVYLPA